MTVAVIADIVGSRRLADRDAAQRELILFALQDEPSERPTAEALLAKTLELGRAGEVNSPSNVTIQRLRVG